MKLIATSLTVAMAIVITALVVRYNPDSVYYNRKQCKSGEMKACEWMVGQRNREHPGGDYSDYTRTKLQDEAKKINQNLQGH